MPKDDENANTWMTFLKNLKPRVEEIEVDGKKITRLVFDKHINAEGITFPKTYENEGVTLEYHDKETGLKWVGKFPFKHAVFKKGASLQGLRLREQYLSMALSLKTMPTLITQRLKDMCHLIVLCLMEWHNLGKQNSKIYTIFLTQFEMRFHQR